jgi:exosortase N
MHELTGIICLVVYVVLPATLITRIAVRKFGRQPGLTGKFTRKLTARKLVTWHTLLLSLTLFAAIRNIRFDNHIQNTSASVIPVPGYAVQRVQSDIIKLNNDQSLIYIKSISGFYNSDHNPMICWKGSGYDFQQVEEQSIENTRIYTGVLQGDKEHLYTAWWYDNGVNRTIDQLTWRWDVMKGGHNYSIVNITAPGKYQLVAQVKNILQDNRLRPLLRSTN